MVLYFFTSLVTAVVFIAPFIALPFSLLVLGLYPTLRLSLGISIHQLVSAYLKTILEDNLSIVLSLFDAISISAFSVLSFMFMPHVVVDVYMYFLSWSGPLMMIVESIQIVRLIAFGGRKLVHSFQMRGPEDNIVKLLKTGVVLSTGISYIISFYTLYTIYQHPSLNVPLAAAFGSIATLFVVTFVVSLAWEHIVTDPAILTLYITFLFRAVFVQYEASRVVGWNYFESPWKTETVSIFSKLWGMATDWLGVDINFSKVTRVLSFDTFLSYAISGIGLLTLPMSLKVGFEYEDEEEENDWVKIVANLLKRLE
eukprot:TRINITY_DN17286_c0_g1_i1.p1 TRINITY_DN17286_c0_g1~~TRINITY_DN17286_c0_g1_i1.p1  ORF type:complete len:312 (+),score=37.20 TRINITY_DN17286_c0_g1_i1:98-1033(+)